MAEKIVMSRHPACMDKLEVTRGLNIERKPIFSDGIWAYTEELYEQTYTKAYPNDTFDYATYIDNYDKTVFLAYSDTECIR